MKNAMPLATILFISALAGCAEGRYIEPGDRVRFPNVDTTTYEVVDQCSPDRVCTQISDSGCVRRGLNGKWDHWDCSKSTRPLCVRDIARNQRIYPRGCVDENSRGDPEMRD